MRKLRGAAYAVAALTDTGMLLTPTFAVDLAQVQKVLASSATSDFGKNIAAYKAAYNWHFERLLRDGGDGLRAPYLGCATYGEGRHAFTSLQSTFGRSAIHRVSNSDEDGSCFIVTASLAEASPILSDPDKFSLLSAAAFLPSLKLATGILDHGPNTSDGSSRLRSTYGESMAGDNVRGLTVRLSPGILPLTDKLSARVFVNDLKAHLLAEDLNMETASFWSDPNADRGAQDKTRVRAWTRAATVVDGLASKHDRSVGEICYLARLRMRHVDDDLLLVEGVGHLLPGEQRPSEKKMACFMGLLSQLAAKPEVLRVSPLLTAENVNSVTSAIVQSANTIETPLYDAGLDGAGEVIQIIDTGLDETSCFFADDDGLQVEHGHLYTGIRTEADGNISIVSEDPSFVYDMSRRKVVQYIELFKKAEDTNGGGDDDAHDVDSFTYVSDYIEDYYYGNDTYDDAYDDTYYSASDTWTEDSFCAGVSVNMSNYVSYADDASDSPTSSSLSSTPYSGGFYKDTAYGHGTWTAGIAAGAISANSGLVAAECAGDEVSGCAGGCIKANDVDEMVGNEVFDIELFCPAYECDGDTELADCLGDDPVETLYEHSGVAPAARISVFDAGYSYSIGFPALGGNSVWESSIETGAKIHSNSWSYWTLCEVTETDIMYDTFMYENPENLLIFAAGNLRGYGVVPIHEWCTVGSPALGKNSLAVGATSAGPSRATYTGADGLLIYDKLGFTDYSPEGYPWICLFPDLGTPSSSTHQADIDTMAWFSSYGPTSDNRIKPDVVAPGDQVFAAASDGTDKSSCTIAGGVGTSASCPVVAGSAALIRQYFKDPSFYTKDFSARGLCDGSSSFKCSAFPPSAATTKAMLINSANVMGGSNEPDSFRGFGRVHLEAGLPIDGAGALGLLVADSSETRIGSNGENVEVVNVDGDAGIELRATLCWIDPPATALSAKQLQHDLDLVVTAPSGATYTMWESGETDTVNVVERVVVPAESVESGSWKVVVSSKELLTDSQSYSLVVTGAIRTSAQGL